MSELPLVHDANAKVVVVLQSQPEEKTKKLKESREKSSEPLVLCDEKFVKKTKYIIRNAGDNLDVRICSTF